VIRKCDFCRLDIECDRCNQRVVPVHWHTCDLDCARHLRELLVNKSKENEGRLDKMEEPLK